MKGIILAGGRGTRLYPITLGVSKQLLPCYDKPLIYYPLSTLMLAGVQDIIIITTFGDSENFQKVLGDGSRFGCNFTYLVQNEPRGIAEAYLLAEKYNGGNATALILGDNVFVGSGLGSALRNEQQINGALIHAVRVSNPEDFGVVEIDSKNKILSLEEKPVSPKSNLAVTGLYLTDSSVYERVKEVTPSRRGELEILSVLQDFQESNNLEVRELERGTAWFDTGNPDSLFEASEYIKLLQSRQNRLICAPEEIAWRNKWISDLQLEKIALEFTAEKYRDKLLSLI